MLMVQHHNDAEAYKDRFEGLRQSRLQTINFYSLFSKHTYHLLDPLRNYIRILGVI